MNDTGKIATPWGAIRFGTFRAFGIDGYFALNIAPRIEETPS
jgi:hypothetical protein